MLPRIVSAYAISVLSLFLFWTSLMMLVWIWLTLSGHYDSDKAQVATPLMFWLVSAGFIALVRGQQAGTDAIVAALAEAAAPKPSLMGRHD